MSRMGWSLVVSCALVVGCGGGGGGSDTGPGTGDAGGGNDAGGGTDGGGDTGSTGDGNDSFADADALTVDGAAVTGAIGSAGDEDYFSFSGTSGEWLHVETVANPTGDPAGLDTVVTLYDASMTQIAENDDAIPAAGRDSVLVTLLPSTGTYYLRVQDHGGRGMASFDYDLYVQSIVSGTAGAVIDAEGGDDAASAQAVVEAGGAGTSTGVALVVGELDHASDVDVYSIEIRADAATPASLGIFFQPTGTSGDGAAAAPASLRLEDPSVGIVVGKVSPGEVLELAPALEVAHTYLLFVERGSTTSDFYAIQILRGVDAPLEMAEATNGLSVTAEPLTFDDPVGTTRTARIRADLPMGDTDYFRVTRVPGETHVSVDCASESTGSGVAALEVRVFTSDGLTQLAMATEASPGGLHVPSTMLGTGDDYLLKLTSSSYDPSVQGTWVRCSVTFAP